MKKIISSIKENYIFWVLFLIGIGLRIYQFPNVPAGFNPDEAYSLYEGYNILNYGIDSWGYHNPVYLVAWGSGMNILQSLLMIPFIAIFGPTKLAARLPIFICFILLIPAVYCLVKRITRNKEIALISMFFVVISPWCIGASGFALESNIAVPMFLFASLFLSKGVENNNYYIIAAIFYGLTLYCYATMWIVVPVVLIMCFIYLLKTGNLKLNWQLITAVLILFVMALPLMLFLLVNNGFMNEVHSAISIPKLSLIRSAEISPLNIPSNIPLYISMLTKGISLYQTSYPYGAYLFVGVVFLAIGLFHLIKRCLSKNRTPIEILFLSIYIFMLVYGLSIYSINENKINFIHIPNIILISCGFYWAYLIIKDKVRYALVLLLIPVVFNSCLSNINYYGNQKEILGSIMEYSAEGLDEALLLAKEKTSNTIYIEPFLSTKYSLVLLSLKITPDEFQNNVELLKRSDLEGWYSTSSIEHDGVNYRFLENYAVDELDYEAVYIFGYKFDGIDLVNAGAKKEHVGCFNVFWFE